MRKTPGIEMKPMVVAVDGSAESEHALRWAADQAALMGCDIRIITCYQHYYGVGDAPGVSWGHFESTKHDAKVAAQASIERVLGTADVDHVLSLGPVDAVLIDHSRDASMLVLGTRSSYGLRSALRSSTTDRITGKVTCPVISIPLDATLMEGAGL